MSRVVICRNEPKRLHIEVSGALGIGLARALESCIDEHLPEAENSPDVLIDLRGVTSYDADGRGVLATVHERLMPRIRRCAYLTDRPRLRGMALYISRRGGADKARPLPTVERAEQWLAQEDAQWGEQAFERTKRLMQRLFSRPKPRARGGGQ